MNNNNKAFTLIELIVVMAIIAVLVLLAAPRFLGYTKEAELTALEQDTKVLSNAIEIYHINNEDWPIGARIDNHGIGGVDELFKIDENKVKPSIKNTKNDIGDYAISTNGKYEGQVFHLDGIKVDSGKIVYGPNIQRLPSITYESSNDWERLTESRGYILADEEDFNYIEDDKALGGHYYQYKGNDKFVIPPKTINGQKVISYHRMFEGTSVEGVASNNDSIIDMSFMFKDNASKLLDTQLLSTSSVTNMQGMFRESNSDIIYVSNFDTSNVEDMSYMFCYANGAPDSLSKFDTSKVTTMRYMLTKINSPILDVSNFNTSNVTSLHAMFAFTDAKVLFVSNFDTSKVTDMGYMFRGVRTKSVDVSNFDTSNVTRMLHMFRETNMPTLDLSSFDTSRVYDFDGFLMDATAKIVYARTTEDANRMNMTLGRPDSLEFKVN